MRAFIYRQASGAVVAVQLCDLAPIQRQQVATLSDLVERNGDRVLGNVDVLTFDEADANLTKELAATSTWARQHDAEQLREFARRAVARYRAEKSKATPETLRDFERYVQNFPLEDPRD